MSFPKVDVVVYSTCSVYNQENEHVVRDALLANPDFCLDPTLPSWPRRGRDLPECPGLDHEALVRSVVEDGTIGFFLARFVRKGSAADKARQERATKNHCKKRKREAAPPAVAAGPQYKPGSWRDRPAAPP